MSNIQYSVRVYFSLGSAVSQSVIFMLFGCVYNGVE